MSAWNHIKEWYEKGLISEMESEFARFLVQLDEQISDEVLLAATACIFAQRQGHLCLDLDEPRDSNHYLFNEEETKIELSTELLNSWKKSLKKNGLISDGGELAPLVLEQGRLYLHRFWKYEQELTEWLKERSITINKLSKEEKRVLKEQLKPNQDLFEVNWQQVAVCLSFLKDLLVISGGPGTGKTHTVLNVIAAQILAHPKEDYRIALAAPTGKAARRLINSIETGKERLPSEVADKLKLPEHALTVHKLLGANYRGSSFTYNKDNKLPYDLVVIDEASMLDITMWTRLIRAIGPETKLVVLGDKDQLASVEAGSILGDICGGENSFSQEISESIREINGTSIPLADHAPPINDCVVFLTKSYRFSEDSGIRKFANAVNHSDIQEAIAILENPAYSDIRLEIPNSENLYQLIQEFCIDHYTEYMSEEKDKRMAAANQKKILCAIRKSNLGMEEINYRAESNIKRKNGMLLSDEWYDGRLVMSTQNDSMLKIRNGEIGFYNQNESFVIFEGEQNVKVAPARLSAYEAAFALTIHKSQGSEFNEVAIVLPKGDNPILSKEILYTAVTRARQNTLIITNKEILEKTITRTVSRKSGIRRKLWGEKL